MATNLAIGDMSQQTNVRHGISHIWELLYHNLVPSGGLKCNRLKKHLIFFTAAAYLGFAISVLHAGVVDEFKLASDAVSGALFGASASLDGHTAIIGAPEVNAAYIYVREGTDWVEQAKLTPSDGAIGDQFGYAVAIHGDIVVVGARWDDDAGFNSGSAYVFIRSGTIWTQEAELIASDGESKDNFGVQVAIDGNTVVVGSPSPFGGSPKPGAAYVFVRDEGVWSEQAKLAASDGEAGDRLGESVAVNGNIAIVGAPLSDDDADSETGSAYVFVRDEGVWSEEAKLTASDASFLDRFGYSVSISGNTAIVGAVLEGGDDSGSAYVFIQKEPGVWEQQEKLTASDAAAENRFGISVAIDGDIAIIGAVLYDDPPEASDVYAYIFVRDEDDWAEIDKLITGSGAATWTEADFIDINGCTAIVGTELEDFPGEIDAGAAYAYLLDTCPCQEAPTDMVSWWTLDELSGPQSKDSKGANHGTWINTPMPTPGMVDGALAFDGASYVEVPDSPSLNFGTERDFTIDAWINPFHTSPVVSIVDKRDSDSGRGYGLRLVDYKLAFIINDGSTPSFSFISTESLPLGKWSHVAITVDRGDDIGRVYINAVEKGTFVPSATASGSIDNTNPLLIANSSDHRLFVGMIDEVELYDRALGPGEIVMLYNALSGGKCCKPCVDPPEDLVAWWPFDEMEGSISEDIVGPNDGTKVGAPSPAEGKVDVALDFIGAGHYVKVADHISLNFGAPESFTMDAWIRPSAVENLLSVIVEKFDTDSRVGYRLFMRSGRLVFQMSDGSSPAFSYISEKIIKPNVWTLVAVTVDRDLDVGRIYVINQIVGFFSDTFIPSATAPGSISNSESLFIGGNLNGDDYFGRIDELEIFNRSLTDNDINAIYIADKKGKCKPETEESDLLRFWIFAIIAIAIFVIIIAFSRRSLRKN